MPEGDTIYRTASVLRPALQRQVIRDARSRDTQIPPRRLINRRVEDIESRGKHLLIHLDDDCCLHTHLGMHGSWHLYLPGQAWQKPEEWAGLHLLTEPIEAACFNPKTMELLSSDQLRRHPHISRLGPDLLAESFDLFDGALRFRRHNSVTIGQAVMNQTIVAGIGNVYKSEILFLTGIHPQTRVGQLSDEQLIALTQLARDLLQKNLQGGPRRTRFSLDRHRHWVYGRNGRACLKCGTRILLTRQGDLGRTTYFCPNCQQKNRKNARNPHSPGAR